MSTMDRREFIRKTAGAVGTALGGQILGCTEAGKVSSLTTTQPAARRLLRATDVVALGKTGVKPSRLAIGTGTLGGMEQGLLGIKGLVRLFRHGLDQGIRWWDAADMYKTHPHVRAALKEVKRDEVTLTSKTRAKDADRIRADIERFRKEMDTDCIDVLLLHCMKDADWPEKMRGAMDALTEAKQKGWVRAVGCSCHSLVALQAAANEPWVEVELARINPFAARIDVKKPDQVPMVERALQLAHEHGKAVYGMKVLGEGSLKDDRIDASLRFLLSRPYVSAFTIGFSRTTDIDDIIQRVEQLRIVV